MKINPFTAILLVSLSSIFMLSCSRDDNDDWLEGDFVSRELRNVIENGNFEFIALRDNDAVSCSRSIFVRDEIRNVEFEGFYISFDDFTFNLNKLTSYCTSGNTLVLDFED